ncbi:phosphoketolase family protein [Candidatus Woesearchaeota archaeon]|nr:phosphoketolase family protein [Candidatus Woesearchaeota archaeon]
MLTKDELDWVDRHWKTSNYLAVASIYLKDNFFLERPLNSNDIKGVLLGHWGTCPGINFIYTHLNLLAKKTKANLLPIVGPGHGFPAILANTFIDGTLKKYYPEYKNDRQGISKLIKSFCWPGGFPSHANPATPGIIHEGGEIGYALATAYGAAFDNPNLIVPVIIGDGEAETGPTAAAWHSNKFLNPKTDGAVLPILHLNGYKISSPAILGTMNDVELNSLFRGYGYDVKFVHESHEEMHNALVWAIKKIKQVKSENSLKPEWPLIILKTRKGWTGPKEHNSNIIEGSWRSHQVPLRDVKENTESLKLLENWLLSYEPKTLFENGKLNKHIFKHLPKNRLTDNPNANGGKLRKELKLPNAKNYEVKFKNKGNLRISSAVVLSNYLKEIIKNNKNFIIVSPDELSSNRLDSVLEITGRKYVWSKGSKDDKLDRNGKVYEILSEHTLQGWLQGYLLTGRHGIFPCYEAFLPIIDSMVSQYLKFIKTSKETKFRKPISSLNYLLTSVAWRQDHNGFSHQNPGFIDVLASKSSEESLVRLYFPADANMLLTTAEHSLRSRDRINVIVSDKQKIRQWLTYSEAKEQAKKGISIWKFASDENPDVVLACCGDYQTEETLAAVKLLKEKVPEINLRIVNISELNVLGQENYQNSLSKSEFENLFTKDKDVIFTFHGYPDTVKQIIYDRDVSRRFDIYGYIESGTTTTPFDLLIRNHVSRYDIAIYALQKAARHNSRVAAKFGHAIKDFENRITEHRKYILKEGKDPEEIRNWTW